jgi:N-acetylglucosamine transport system permease protein
MKRIADVRPVLPDIDAAATAHTERVVRKRLDRLDAALAAFIRLGLWIWTLLLVALTLWVILTSLKTSKEIFDRPFGLPAKPQWHNYEVAWNVAGLGKAALNSVCVVAFAAAATIVVSAPASYVLARVARPSASRITTFFAIGMGIPIQALLVPLFLMSNDLSSFMTKWVTGWWDDRISLALVYIVVSLPFTVFLLAAYFRSLPTELEEAAAIDGASPSRTFVEIMLPLARHGITTALVLNVVAMWNETLLVLVLIGDPTQRTLPAALLELYNTMQYTSNWGGLFAGIVILVLPMILLYLWVGRRIVQGMTQGALK